MLAVYLPFTTREQQAGENRAGRPGRSPHRHKLLMSGRRWVTTALRPAVGPGMAGALQCGVVWWVELASYMVTTTSAMKYLHRPQRYPSANGTNEADERITHEHMRWMEAYVLIRRIDRLIDPPHECEQGGSGAVVVDRDQVLHVEDGAARVVEPVRLRPQACRRRAGTSIHTRVEGSASWLIWSRGQCRRLTLPSCRLPYGEARSSR